jgi:ribosomal protein S18 acetylase RimI-like enzyme
MPENSGELSRLYLRKSAQGGGLGARLLETALEFLRDRFEHVYLSVYAENTVAQRLYGRYGFVKVHDYFYRVGDHLDPEWIMKLKEP